MTRKVSREQLHCPNNVVRVLSDRATVKGEIQRMIALALEPCTGARDRHIYKGIKCRGRTSGYFEMLSTERHLDGGRNGGLTRKVPRDF